MRLLVVVPTELNAEQRELLKQLDESFKQSEQSSGKGIMDRVREALFMAANQARRIDPTLAARYHRLMVCQVLAA